ncbi:16S rRNA (guanine(527)-N(7))-methyltransferase RsmG [Candidatus Hepatincolaceae symbiont of Richtersius coronifer]
MKSIVEYLKPFNLTFDQQEALIIYTEVLLKWQNNFNLIGPSTTSTLWSRHIVDSLQLRDFFPIIQINNQNIYDLGSGAGLPGMVLAIADHFSDFPQQNYFLVEANIKKAAFLAEIKRKLNLLNVTILNKRIEEIGILDPSFLADFLVARGLARLDNLFALSLPLLKPTGKCIFLKGKDYENEVALLKSRFSHLKLNLSIHFSLYAEQGKIIQISL